MGYQEMRGSARRCEEMRADTRRCEVIQGDRRGCEEMRGWLRGMAVSFIFPPRRQQQDFRVGGGAWGLGPGTGGRLGSFFPEGGTSWTVGLGMGMGIRTWHRGMSFRFILFLRRHHQDSMVGAGVDED